MHTQVFWDTETKKFFDEIETQNPADLGVSIVSVYTRKVDDDFKEIEGKMFSFWEDEFEKMWPIFEEADRIVGFNSIKFDVPAVSPYAPSHFAKLPHFDIMAEVKNVFGRRISLDAIAKETLGTYKIDSGANAVIYWNKHDEESLAKLKKYCEMDVTITRDVYDFAFKNKKLKFKDKWNTPVEVQLDFSYPVVTPEPQMGLF